MLSLIRSLAPVGKSRLAWTPATLAALSVAILVGCMKSGPDPALVAQYRVQVALAEEPAGVETVYEIREDLLGISHEDHEHEHEAQEHPEAETETDHAEAEADEHAHEGESEATTDEHAEADHEEEADHEHEHEPVVVTEATEKKPVVLLGQVGGLANPWEETQPEYPFAEGQAIFFLSDPQAITEHSEAGHHHAPGEECAFCAAHAEENSELIAVVRVVDDKGKVIPLDSRDLFDLKTSDLVVVEGDAQVLAGGMMVVEAKGVYVRR